MLAGKTFLLEFLQIDCGVLQNIARLAQRLFASLTHQQCRLQLLLGRFIFAARQIGAQLDQILLELRQRIINLLSVVLQIGDFFRAGFGKKARLLQRMLGLLRPAVLLA